MDNKFLNFMNDLLAWGKPYEYLLDISNNNGQTKIIYKKTDVSPAADEIQKLFMNNCMTLLNMDYDNASDVAKLKKREEVNGYLVARIHYMLDEIIDIEKGSELTYTKIAQDLVTKLIDPLMSAAEEITTDVNVVEYLKGKAQEYKPN